MISTEFTLKYDCESNNRTSETAYKDRNLQQGQYYPHHSSYPPHKNKIPLIIIILIIVVILCSIIYLGNILIERATLESFNFTFDSEAELDDTLLNELYYGLDADSRLNVTNETYFLILSIPELDYSIRFDYLFEFTSENQTNLRIEQHDVVPEITNFEGRYANDPYDLSIEFQINSTDPDIIGVMIFPEDNIINGNLYTRTTDSWILIIRLEEGEVIHGHPHETMIIPHNQRIIGIENLG